MPDTARQKYTDRTEAGRVLAGLLREYAGRPDVVVLALPRGGVPVGYEVARALGAPLDVFLVRKLGVPGHEELAMGAIASGGVRVLNPDVVTALRIPRGAVDSVAARELAELERREAAYRGGRPPPEVRGRTVILVDDGLATGSTMRAAAEALRDRGPAWLVVAVPVAAAETCDDFAREVDQVVCARTPEPFYAVGLWYDDFSQTTDDEVRALLARAAEARAGGAGHGTSNREGDMEQERTSRDPDESGQPGGGTGRREEVGGSGVYPASAGNAPADAVIRGQAEWGQGDRGARGYEDSGPSELHPGGEAPRADDEREGGA
jgi:putative phosphoribosyl transferase